MTEFDFTLEFIYLVSPNNYLIVVGFIHSGATGTKFFVTLNFKHKLCKSQFQISGEGNFLKKRNQFKACLKIIILVMACSGSPPPSLFLDLISKNRPQKPFETSSKRYFQRNYVIRYLRLSEKVYEAKRSVQMSCTLLFTPENFKVQ